MKIKLKDTKCPFCLGAVIVSRLQIECENGHKLSGKDWRDQEKIDQARGYVEDLQP